MSENAARAAPIGILMSAGGAAFEAAVQRLEMDIRGKLLVVTDRPCGAERKAADLGIRQVRVRRGSGAIETSRSIRQVLETAGAFCCVTLYDRLLSPDLFDALPCINIHPSILPDFSGMDAVRRAFQAGSKSLGVTSHLIDAGVDTGPILKQMACPMPKTLPEAEHLAFRLKARILEDLLRSLSANQRIPPPDRSYLWLEPQTSDVP